MAIAARHPQQQVEEMEHRIALQLAAPLRKKPHAEAERSILAWFDGSTIIRESILKAQRTYKNRMRSEKTPVESRNGFSLIAEIAALVVMRVVGKAKLEDLSAVDLEHVKAACAEAGQAAQEVDEAAQREPAEGVDATSAAAYALVVVAGASAYAHATGTQVMGSIATPSILGFGKHNSPMRIATLALAELGVPNAEIQRALQVARPGALKSRAQIRRLARPARTS